MASIGWCEQCSLQAVRLDGGLNVPPLFLSDIPTTAIEEHSWLLTGHGSSDIRNGSKYCPCINYLNLFLRHLQMKTLRNKEGKLLAHHPSA